MTFWKIITLACVTSVVADAKWLKHQKRDIPSNICDPVHNNTNLVQCYCNKNRDSQEIRNADCYLTDTSVSPEHNAWKALKDLKDAHKITFTNTRGIPLAYVPTKGISEATSVLKFEIKYGIIERVEPFAFGNVSSVEEITLRDNRITILSPHAFAHHKHLKIISLDTNSLLEINRNVFVDLPALEKLYLTNNEISTLHDRAFVHLGNLKELEIDRNKVFSLNFATFEGLKNLEKLDLSSNALEVIGDNTFEALKNLKYLNLQENKIQMLDEKAFNGLGKLISLSLTRNKLTEIENVKVFEGLESLLSLSLRGNQITELKPAVMAPILNNFYGNNSILDFEDNNFPCGCSLDWFTSFMNKTLNKHLKISIENLKCVPDAALKEAWTKTTEAPDGDKNAQQGFEDEESQVQDYEYYDESQLNGKLFYLDVRDYLNCDNNTKKITNINTMPAFKTKEETSPTPATSPVTNQGLLDLSLVDTTTTAVKTAATELKAATNKREKNVEKEFTTTRLATVSAKPEESKIYEDMASDEGRPDKINAHRSVQNEVPAGNTNKASRSFSCVTLFVVMILLKGLAVIY